MKTANLQQEIKLKLQQAIDTKGIAILSPLECRVVLGWLAGRGRKVVENPTASTLRSRKSRAAKATATSPASLGYCADCEIIMSTSTPATVVRNGWPLCELCAG